MPGGFGALLLRLDALPDANPPLFRACCVLDCTPLRQRNIVRKYLRSSSFVDATILILFFFSTDRDFLEQRRRSLQRFLNIIARHPTISNEQILKYFFTYKGSVSSFEAQSY